MLIENLQSKTKLALLTVIATIAGCAVICLGVFYAALHMVSERNKQIYVLQGSTPLLAERTDLEVNLEVECRSHIEMFHQFFFTLAPDEDYIKWTLGKAMYLCDESGMQQKNSLEEKGFYSKLQSATAYFFIHTDSIRIDMEKMTFEYYGTQRIERPSSILTRSLVTAGVLKSSKRTHNNPHGLLITQWRTVSNKDIEYRSKAGL